MVVEVDLAPGLLGVQLVGLPDKAIQKSREKVRSTLRNSGSRGPMVRVLINLAPADLRKEGPSFDLTHRPGPPAEGGRVGTLRQPQALSRGDCPRRKGPAAEGPGPGGSP